jgi:hypothetical protein
VNIRKEAAKAMKSIDNTIKFVASGSSYYESTDQWVEWNRKGCTRELIIFIKSWKKPGFIIYIMNLPVHPMNG